MVSVLGKFNNLPTQAGTSNLEEMEKKERFVLKNKKLGIEKREKRGNRGKELITHEASKA